MDEITFSKLMKLMKPPITEVTADRTLSASDLEGWLRYNSGSNLTLTIPPDGSLTADVNSSVLVSRAGAGSVTLVPGSGVTINSAGGYLSISSQFGMIEVIKMGTNLWSVVGNLG